jgi:hypothetical protein
VARARWLPLSGIVFVVLGLLAVVVFGGSTPDTDASAAKVASFYDAHMGRQAIAAFLLAASAPFLVLFGVQLSTALSTAQRSAIWERFLVAGSAVAGATIIFGALTHFALADAADNGVSGDAIRALNILDTDGWVAFNSGLGVMMLGAGWAVVAAARLLPRWLGWVAVVVGVLLFIPFADFIALLLTLIWIIVASIMLWRTHERSVVAATPQTA